MPVETPSRTRRARAGAHHAAAGPRPRPRSNPRRPSRPTPSYQALQDDDGVLTVDLSEEFQSLEGQRAIIATGQVVCTATDLEEIDGVRFGIEGEDITVNDAEGSSRIGPCSAGLPGDGRPVDRLAVTTSPSSSRRSSFPLLVRGSSSTDHLLGPLEEGASRASEPGHVVGRGLPHHGGAHRWPHRSSATPNTATSATPGAAAAPAPPQQVDVDPSRDDEVVAPSFEPEVTRVVEVTHVSHGELVAATPGRCAPGPASTRTGRMKAPRTTAPSGSVRRRRWARARPTVPGRSCHSGPEREVNCPSVDP